MPLPYTLQAGTVAHADEVMANLNYILAAIGTLSTTGRLEPPGEVFLGPRRTTQLSSSHDTTGVQYAEDDNRDFYHIGWNADYYNTNVLDARGRPIYKYRRVSVTEAATAVRIGNKGFEVWTTYIRAGGNLDAQIRLALKIRELTEDEGYVFLPNRFHFQNKDAAATDVETYRLQQVRLANPVTLFGSATLGAGAAQVKKATDYGIPKHAKMIRVSANFKNSGSYAKLMILQQRDNRHERFGMVVAGAGGGSSEGDVPLGTGAHEGKFAIDRDGPMSDLNVYIVGYWV